MKSIPEQEDDLKKILSDNHTTISILFYAVIGLLAAL